jgi:hypothetical protein
LLPTANREHSSLSKYFDHKTGFPFRGKETAQNICNNNTNRTHPGLKRKEIKEKEHNDIVSMNSNYAYPVAEEISR